MTSSRHKTEALPSICLVIPYFGRWPFWFESFLQSVRWNPSIDWVFYTDCGVPTSAPDNVRFVELSFEAYCQRVSSALGIVFKPTSPYKLCDIKPCLGLIHESDLQGYDFWGFSDIDLIYGDLRRYLNPRLSYDLISTHERRVSGHFCLMRNTEAMRRLFMRVPSWREMLASERHCAFDEGPFSRLFIRRKNWPRWARRCLDLFNPLRRKALFEEAFTTPGGRIDWRDGSRSFPKAWFWKDGELASDQQSPESAPYFHFIQWKCDCWGKAPAYNVPLGARRFSVTAEGFFAE